MYNAVATLSDTEQLDTKISGESAIEGSLATEEPAGTGTGTKLWQLRKQAIRIHTEAYDTLLALQRHRTAWNMLDAEQHRLADALLNFYCPMQTRFFDSQTSLHSSYKALLGFIPPKMTSLTRQTVMSESDAAALDVAIHDLLPFLWPSHEFYPMREHARLRILRLLVDAGVLKEGSDLLIFGTFCTSIMLLKRVRFVFRALTFRCRFLEEYLRDGWR